MSASQVSHDARLRLGAVHLPALPEVLLKLLQLFRRDDAGLDDFAGLIGQDAGLTARLMAVANSAAYRGRGPAHGLDRAMATLGTDVVKTLVISQSIFQTFNSLPAMRRLDLRAFWRHSLLAASAAQEAARRLGYPRHDEAYVAGLLHDIGRLGLLAAMPELYLDFFNAADSADQCEAERRTFHVSHAEAGAWLIERWKLDAYVADSVRYHHEPLPRIAEAHPLIRIVAFGHWLADGPADSPVVVEAGALCGMSAQHVAEVAVLAEQRLLAAAEQLGLDLGAPTPRSSGTPAADRLMEELTPMMVAATVLKELPLQALEAELLQRLADAARIVFQFTEVVVMLADGDTRALRWIGVVQPSIAGAMPPQWLEFGLPCSAGTRVGDELAARRPVFIARHGTPLSVAEDQLLRLLGTEQLVCLPLAAPDAQRLAGGAAAGALVCVGDAGLLAGLTPRQDFLMAFMAQADAARQRASQLRAVGERRLADQTARQVESARRLVHEVNNPLSIIQNYLTLLDGKLTGMPAFGDNIRILQEEVARVGRLVQAISHPQAPVPAAAVDPNRLIADVARLFSQAQASEPRIEILAIGRAGAGEVHADADALRQVIVNLVKNAVEALPSGGRVVLTNNGLVNLDGRLYLELSVRDDGPGLAPEVWSRLFTPAVGGTAPAREPGASAQRGLGLSIVHGLVAGLGGLMQCRSSVMGTTFDILLPHRQTAEAVSQRRITA